MKNLEELLLKAWNNGFRSGYKEAKSEEGWDWSVFINKKETQQAVKKIVGLDDVVGRSEQVFCEKCQCTRTMFCEDCPDI